MHVIYNISILLFGFAIRIASIFKSKPKKWIAGRRNLYQDSPSIANREVIWFHCASLGEFDQGLPLMEEVRKNKPDSFIIVTFFSPSGMDHYHKRNHPADYVNYIALDTPGNAKRFIERFKPSVCFFVKYEFWSNHIKEAKLAGAMLYNISGLFRQNHRFFKSWGGYFKNTLKQFDWFFVQNMESMELLNSINISNVSVSGDTRFDRVYRNAQAANSNEKIETFKGDKDLLIIGSSWQEDEAAFLNYANKHEMKVLVAPHDVSGKSIDQLVQSLNSSFRYSETTKEELIGAKILVLDTIGHLTDAYKYGQIAYIGGGFKGKLHNILEPAVFGLPVLFGPHHSRYPEAQLFIDEGIGFSVCNSSEFENRINEIQQNYSTISNLTKSFIENQIGASVKIYNHCFNAN